MNDQSRPEQPELSSEASAAFAGLRQTLGNGEASEWRNAETAAPADAAPQSQDFVLVSETEQIPTAEVPKESGGATEEFVFVEETGPAPEAEAPAPEEFQTAGFQPDGFQPEAFQAPFQPQAPQVPQPVQSHPVRVGLLVWSGILIMSGLIILTVMLFPVANSQIVLIGFLVFFGILFLIGAITVSAKSRR